MDADKVLDALATPCAELGVEVVDVEELRGGAGGRSASVLRVTVDRPHAALDLDAVAAVSSVISSVLDADPSLTPRGGYDLEVTSPGVERRLRRPAHFQALVGATVALKTHPSVSGDRRVEGVLEQADDDGFSLAVARGTRRFGYGEVTEAHTVFDWRAALAAGARREEGD